MYLERVTDAQPLSSIHNRCLETGMYQALRYRFLSLAKTRTSVPSMSHCLVAYYNGAFFDHKTMDNKCPWCGYK